MIIQSEQYGYSRAYWLTRYGILFIFMAPLTPNEERVLKETFIKVPDCFLRLDNFDHFSRVEMPHDQATLSIP